MWTFLLKKIKEAQKYYNSYTSILQHSDVSARANLAEASFTVCSKTMTCAASVLTFVQNKECMNGCMRQI